MVGEEKSIEAAGFNPHYLLDALGALDAPYRALFLHRARQALPHHGPGDD